MLIVVHYSSMTVTSGFPQTFATLGSSFNCFKTDKEMAIYISVGWIYGKIWI